MEVPMQRTTLFVCVLLLLVLSGCVSVKLDLRDQRCPIYLSDKTGMDEAVQKEKTEPTGKQYYFRDYRMIATGSDRSQVEWAKNEERLARDEFVTGMMMNAQVYTATIILAPNMDSKEIEGRGYWHEFKYLEGNQ
jgi:hypothetical protein